ncbi:hypothetical protein NKR23_g7361 [Pleurostoma richardsiae]|uniref:Uncharacterized protein n=1 Tax=Pleurostoma richardsiae TaxID=41990 RepID=A0AA38VDF6_9PEZI|nr:hypothetical protein NKR23_g7361 [Pleurostoma richardsiae]
MLQTTQFVKPEDRMATIPLHCILCPKQPTFSDVSHLLTHISSKSHLANRFRLELRAKTENDARAQLNRFEHWYTENSIERLLSERLAAKEAKKPSKRGARGSAIPMKPRQTTDEEPVIKSEQEREDVGLLPLYHWNTLGNRQSVHLHDPRRDLLSEDRFQTPARRTRSRYALPESPDSPSPVIKLESSRSTTETIDSIAPVTEVGAELDNTGFSELKGAKWPGMGRFDSATDEQKRKRNQKKDRSVLQSMVISSESVTPTEHVWDDYFNELKRTRNIYDSPSIEGTPDHKGQVEETESPVKKRRSRRVAGSQAACTTPPACSMTSSTAKDLLYIEGDLGTTADNHNNDEINVFLDGPEPAPGGINAPMAEARCDLVYRPVLQTLPPNITNIGAQHRAFGQMTPTYPFLSNKGAEQLVYPTAAPENVRSSYFPSRPQRFPIELSNLNPLCQEVFHYHFDNSVPGSMLNFESIVNGLPSNVGAQDSPYTAPGTHSNTDFDL